MGSSSSPGGSPVGPPNSANQGPLQAATPPIGSQTTDQGWGTENPGVVRIAVSKWDGTADGIYDPSWEEDNAITCTVSHGPSQLIFPNDEKPIVYGAIPMISGAPTNSCGQVWTFCAFKDSKAEYGHVDVYAQFNDEGSIYRSDTVKIDCGKTYSSPVVLPLKPTFSNAAPEIPPNTSSGDNDNPLPMAPLHHQ